MSQTTSVNRQWLVADHPNGRGLRDSDFHYHESPVPEPETGQILVRSSHFGFDPAQKGWMEVTSRYVTPVPIGGIVRGTTVGEVVASHSPAFAVGDLISGMWGWQDYAVLDAVPDPLTLDKLPQYRPVTAALSVLGLTGVTAYFGLLDIGKPIAGDTVVISGAAGATGSTVGQIAKIAGCRVIGIAGGKDKCDWLTGELGFDGAIDYKSEDIMARLKVLCPGGIDIFFDNVGGPILDAALARLALNARVVICGGISRYEQSATPPGPENYFNLVFMRARMEGFIVLDYAARFAAARKRLWSWVEAGRLAYKEDVQHGFENAPQTLMRLFQGKNFGKQLLKVAD